MQRSGAIVQKPEGSNTYDLKIWLKPSGNHVCSLPLPSSFLLPVPWFIDQLRRPEAGKRRGKGPPSILTMKRNGQKSIHGPPVSPIPWRTISFIFWFKILVLSMFNMRWVEKIITTLCLQSQPLPCASFTLAFKTCTKDFSGIRLYNLNGSRPMGRDGSVQSQKLSRHVQKMS